MKRLLARWGWGQGLLVRLGYTIRWTPMCVRRADGSIDRKVDKRYRIEVWR